MKKYIHIKSGIIAEEKSWIDYTYSKDGRYYEVPAELIEGSLDWQLKPSFEITAFRDKVDDVLIKLNSDGLYLCDCHEWEHNYERCIEQVEMKRFEIFSVMREDGIEFSLQQKTEQGEIEKFIITSENEMIAKMTNMNGYYINSLTPAKKVILTTEDGVEITDEHDRLFYLCLDNNAIHNGIAKHYDSKQIDWVYFSTREAAEDYINKNKPKYSENQIREAWGKLWSDDGQPDKLIHKLNEKK